MADTIAAIATPTGRGGVGIIRISGARVREIAIELLGRVPKSRYAEYHHFKDKNNETIDDGLALFFPNPHSFTGEDVLELQGHGGAVVLDVLLKRVLSFGARMARPGEFSERAFLNGKIDLAQAEAIADLIDASSEKAAKCAQRSLSGVFSTIINTLVERLIELRTYVEAAIDFADEDVDFLSDGKIEKRLLQIMKDIEKTLQQARGGALLRDGMKVVIAGKPNVGKSSLLNLLSGEERAIVTEIAGTTRDVLREKILIDGVPLHIIDTAGLRQSPDIIEQEGIRRAEQALQECDHVLFLVDDNLDEVPDFSLLTNSISPEKLTVVFNKIDLSNKAPDSLKTEQGEHIWLSAKTGNGVALLKKRLLQVVGIDNSAESLFIARRRHLTALTSAHQHLATGHQHLVQTAAGELLAEELGQAQQHLSEITGQFTSDDLLGRIFSSFCIGK